MKIIAEFYWDCGHLGYLEGAFICEKEEITKIIGREVCFGKVLGKNSEISGKLAEKDFDIKTEDSIFIDKFIEVFGEGTISGFNPFDYLNSDLIINSLA